MASGKHKKRASRIKWQKEQRKLKAQAARQLGTFIDMIPQTPMANSLPGRTCRLG